MRTYFVRLATVAAALAVAVAGAPADACTAFLLKASGGPVMAANFDWDVAVGQLVVNPRGLAKTALAADESKPVRWTSRYGSVTLNQHGREFPLGGMNEAGLAMEVLWLAGTTYPEPGDRPSIQTLQWVQYCLDSFRTVSDVVASASELAIGGSAPLHFFACDASASCAVVEFIDGKLVERSERTLPLPVLTNDTYAESLEFLNRTLGYGGEPVKPEGPGSLARFARAANGAHAARRSPGPDAVADAFEILADVRQPDRTRWSVVYDLNAIRVHVTSAANPNRRFLDLADLDLDCTAAPLVLDVASQGTGDLASALEPYTPEANRRLVAAGLKAEKLQPVSPETVELLASYPDRLHCTFDEPAK